MNRLLVVGALSVLILGCSQEESRPASVENEPWVVIQEAAKYESGNPTTPDTVVKEWWRVQDATLKFESVMCQQVSSLIPSRKDVGNFATSDMLDWLNKTPDCSIQTYDRRIEKVEEQSQTMAVVYAVARNTTPSDAGWIPEGNEREAKERGERFKYVLTRENAQSSWKIENIFEFPSYRREWTPIYTKLKPSGNQYVTSHSQ